MNVALSVDEKGTTGRPASWSAVFAMALSVATLIASEFMPVSLLTPIATDLHMTEGQAGQAIAVSGLFAVITSLFIAAATAGHDRRHVMLGLTLVMAASGVVVATAHSYEMLMAGRALLGIAIGGFWSMSTAIVMRLVPAESVPKALAILNGGNALAATIAAPLGSFLGAFIGWRGAFFCVVPLAMLTLAWQSASMPSVRAKTPTRFGNVFGLLRRPAVAWGMGGILMLFMGQFALFTYLRPFLETVTGVSVSILSLILLLIGLTGLVGTWIIGMLLKTRLFSLLILIPFGMAAIAVALIALGQSPWGTAILLAGWGLIGTPAPVGWNTWLSRTLPQDAEAGGGLMVAVIQFAITLGATAGGWLYDATGWQSTFGLSAVILLAAAFMAFMAQRVGSRESRVRSASGCKTLQYKVS